MVEAKVPWYLVSQLLKWHVCFHHYIDRCNVLILIDATLLKHLQVKEWQLLHNVGIKKSRYPLHQSLRHHASYGHRSTFCIELFVWLVLNIVLMLCLQCRSWEACLVEVLRHGFLGLCGIMNLHPRMVGESSLTKLQFSTWSIGTRDPEHFLSSYYCLMEEILHTLPK